MKYQGPNRPTDSLDIFFLQSAVGSLIGGCSLALIALFFRKDLALGFFVGALLCPLNLKMVRVFFKKLRQTGLVQRSFLFWVNHFGRWLLFSALFWVLFKLSLACALGAVGSYLCLLLVMIVVALRLQRMSSPSVGPVPGPTSRD